MRKFGEEYLSTSAYFIAGGSTLEIIHQFEADVKNYKGLLADVARDYGALAVHGTDRASFILDHQTNNAALIQTGGVFDNKASGRKEYIYEVNKKTPEGRALQERMENIPERLGSPVFARRLTGDAFTPVNPDRLMEPGTHNLNYGNRLDSVIAATYHQYGDVYVVEVPRTIRGVFNATSQKESEKFKTKRAAGFRYDWFKPLDSEAIPDSKVMALRETELYDQTKPRRVRAKINCLVRYP